MISILVALVRFGQLANINAETGAPCFAAVVVLTMFAVITFDPRLMWDGPRARAAEPASVPSAVVQPDPPAPTGAKDVLA
jgi:paraquat-inducible protein A